MNIALAQIDVKAGDPEANFENIKKYILQAKDQNVDIVAFPELCVSGYLLGDLWTDDEYCSYLMSFNDKIKELSKIYQIGVIYGNVYLMNNEKSTIRFCNDDGRNIKFNAAYAFYNGKVVKRSLKSKYLPDGIQPKTLLPNYRYFDDKRYFMSSWDFYSKYNDDFMSIISPFEFEIDNKKHKVGVELCEDMWCKDYNLNPSFSLSALGAEIIINISASPWTYEKNIARDRRVGEVLEWDRKKYRRKFPNPETGKDEISYNRWYSEHEKTQAKEMTDSNGVCYFNEEEWIPFPSYPPFAYVNCVGAQNNGKNILTFDGASTVYGQDGEPKILANSNFEEELLIFDSEDLPRLTSYRGSNSSISRKYQAIIRGIQHITDITGVKKYVIGLSGGIDSAVVACLLVKIFGKDNVIAINMPSRYNSQKTQNAAKNIADNLGITFYYTHSIEDLYKVNLDISRRVMNPIKSDLTDLEKENIQAKIRGTCILSNMAASWGALFTNNGNKIETALGYATLYGDIGGAIAPISDLTKSEVYQMAKYLNKEIFKDEVIPFELIPNDNYQFEDDQIKPSAELKNDQVDPIKIGYHCKLIEKFMDYNKTRPSQIMKKWLDNELPEFLGMDRKLMEIYDLNNPNIFINDLKWVCEKIRFSVFKRVQSPPNIITSKTAFGYDLRESILPKFQWTQKEKELERKILNKG